MSVELTIIRSSGAEVGYWYGKSTDPKPAAGTLYLQTGSKFYELDTKIEYEYSEKNVNPDTGNGWWVKTDMNALILPLTEKLGYGVLSGLAVTAQSTPDMTVNMSAGIYYKPDGTRQSVLALTAQAIQTADTVKDRIDLIYKSAAGVATYIVGIIEIDAVAGARSYTITTNAVEGDTVVIDGQTFTAIRTTPGTDEFNLGVGTTATATALYNCLNANTDITDIYTVTNPSAGVVRLVEKTAGGGDTPGASEITGSIRITNGSPTASAAAVPGERAFTVAVNAVADDTLTIDAQTFTAVAADPAAGQFVPGIDAAATAAALAALFAANATINGRYTITNPSDGVILLVEKTAGGGNTPSVATFTGTISITNGTAVTSAAAVAGARDYTVTTNAAHKDTIALMGELFTALKAAAGTDEFVPGVTAALTATALYNLINANAALSALYTATNPSGGVVLVTEKVPGGLDTPGAAEVTGTIEITNGAPTASVAHEAGGTAPATPAGGVALAEINVDANQTIVETADITDKRVAWVSPGPS
jgi:hypothetical protein